MTTPLVSSNLLDAQPKSKPRKLIVCIDGTSNQFGEKNTNVVELYSRITKDQTQLTYYNSGIGTYAKPFWLSFAYVKQVLLNRFDLAIAWDFDKVLLGAYRWLADTYEPGDQIFMFGFSRGAYQVRTLAAMIEVVGLINPGNQEQIPFAWQLYSDNDPVSAAQFKRAFCRKQVDLHFVGVWDTVASVGIFPRKPFLLADRREHITHFRHALALDERRVKFLPEYTQNIDPWIKSRLSGPIKENQAPDIATPFKGSIKEVWFAGTHSDIGGGNKANKTLDRGGEPLKWMMEEAQRAGLSVRLYDVRIGTPHAEVFESLRGRWWILECFPISWNVYNPDDRSTAFTRCLHLGKPRQVLPDQTVHWTVRASMVKGELKTAEQPQLLYRPRALLVNPADEPVGDWVDMLHERNTIHSWEGDPDLTEMVELIENNPELGQERLWLERLYKYAKDGKLQDIWAYGGPRFLNRLITNYPNNKKAVEIMRLMIGFTNDLKLLSNSSSPGRTPNLKDVWGWRLSAEDRLNKMVIPRVLLLLKQWGAELPDTVAEAQPQHLWTRFLRLFKSQSRSKVDASPVDAQWNLDRIPKSDRSVNFACALLDLVVDLANLDPVQQIPDIVEKLASLTLLMLPSPATSDQQLTARETDLARVVLNTMVTLFKHEAARRVFASKRDEKDLELLRLNDAKTYPQLTLPIIRVVAVLGQDDDCVTRMDSYGRITTTLLELLVADDKLVSEAAAALVVLSKSDQGGKTISNQENLDKLFELLGSKTCFDEILQILANISQRYAREFDEIKVDYLAQLMNDHAEASIAVANIVTEDSPNRALALFSRFQSLPDQLTEETEEQIAEKTIRLLTHDDKRQVQAAVDIVKAFVERDRSIDKLLRLNVSSALADLLRSTSISQKLATEILDTVIQLALRGAGSITNDLIDYLTLLALEGDTQAMLAMLATAAYDKSRREGSQKYIHHLVPIVGSDNYRLIKQSIQALTVLTQHGYGQEDTLPNEVLNAVINLICSATEDTWYKSLESMDLQDETLVAAFNLIQAVSDDSTIRKLLIESGIFEAMLAVEDSSIGHKVHSKARDTLTSLGKQYSDLKLITDELISTEDALLALSNRRRFGEQDQEEEEESEDESEGEEVNETTALVGDRS